MWCRLVLISILFSSCKHEIKVSGIVVDKITKQPLENVLVRTIRDANSSGIDFIETKSIKNGRFTLNFSSQHINNNKIALELSKEGYLTNIYSFFQGRPEDTFLLERQN
jgi:hypothetical protein